MALAEVDDPLVPILKDFPRQPSPAPMRFHVEKEGEMPDSGSSAKSSLPVSRQPTPGPNLPPSSLAAHDVGRPNTPDAIKVTRAKKSGKKTRTTSTTKESPVGLH